MEKMDNLQIDSLKNIFSKISYEKRLAIKEFYPKINFFFSYREELSFYYGSRLNKDALYGLILRIKNDENVHPIIIHATVLILIKYLTKYKESSELQKNAQSLFQILKYNKKISNTAAIQLFFDIMFPGK